MPAGMTLDILSMSFQTQFIQNTDTHHKLLAMGLIFLQRQTEQKQPRLIHKYAIMYIYTNIHTRAADVYF